MITNTYNVDLLYGVRAIGEVLGLTEKQADHLIRDGRIPTFKLGGRVCSRRSVLNGWLDQKLPSS